MGAKIYATFPYDWNTARIFHEFLCGQWILRRCIPKKAIFHGDASFEQQAKDSLLYKESGKLEIKNGPVLDAHRQFEYRLVDDQIHILYADGPESGTVLHELSFYPVPASNVKLSARHVHICGHDKYDLTFLILDNNYFNSCYNIRGPEKNYRIITYYNRKIRVS